MATELSEQAQPRANPSHTDDKSTPNCWWKWILMYPTLGVTILSAIPTYVEFVGSHVTKVPFGHYKTAVRENELWKENFQCADAPFDGVTNKHNIEVDAVVCKSGNVLVRVKPPGQDTAYKWVPLDSITQKTSAVSFIGTAHAQTNNQATCQKWIGNGMVRKQVKNKVKNQCVEEVVNTFNGKVISSKVVPCTCGAS